MTTTPSLPRLNTQASALFQTSVDIRVSKGRLSKAGSIDTAIVYVVEPLEESHAVDEVESASRVTADVVHDKENVVSRTANERVQLQTESHRSSFVTAANQVVLTARGHS